jgi:glycosyltransferase involved in cell wall biosynthesis
MRPLRILWVKVGGLWPPNTGGRLRSLNMLGELSRHHRVTLVTTHAHEEDRDVLAAHRSDCERIESIPYAITKRGTSKFALDLARSWMSSYPADLCRWRVRGLRSLLHREFSKGVDVCVADFLVAMANVPSGGSTPVILFEHNVEYVIWKRLAQVESAPWRRALLELEWRKMRRREILACRRATRTIAVSEADRALLAANAPGADIRAIPTGVDTSYFHPNGAGEDPGALVFTGSMDWYRNEDAIIHFIDAILPAVRSRVPGVHLAVVGRSPTERLRAAGAAAGVRVTGTVTDVRPYIAEASVYIVPLRIGGGTRLKIFEALAMGKGVVATGVGAEGLPIMPGEHFLRADDPTAFAEAVVDLLGDPARRRALGAAGRRLVEDRYSWAHVAKDFERHCQEVALSHAR